MKLETTDIVTVYVPDGAHSSDQQFDAPESMAIDDQGSLYVKDECASMIFCKGQWARVHIQHDERRHRVDEQGHD